MACKSAEFPCSFRDLSIVLTQKRVSQVSRKKLEFIHNGKVPGVKCKARPRVSVWTSQVTLLSVLMVIVCGILEGFGISIA